MKNKFNYGERLRQLRIERGFTQEEIALRADITTSYYSQIERGTANPTTRCLEKICNVLSIPITNIFTGSDTNLLRIDTQSMYNIDKFIKNLKMNLMKLKFKVSVFSLFQRAVITLAVTAYSGLRNFPVYLSK